MIHIKRDGKWIEMTPEEFYATSDLKITPISKSRHHWNRLVKYINGLFYKVPSIPQHIAGARSHNFHALRAQSHSVSFKRSHAANEEMKKWADRQLPNDGPAYIVLRR